MVKIDFKFSFWRTDMFTVSSLDRSPTPPAFHLVREAVAEMAEASVEGRGAVFTRREVVDFILDLSGYTVERPLASYRLLEPSFGAGDFLLPVVERLIAAWVNGPGGSVETGLRDAIRAVEIHEETLSNASGKVIALLERSGIGARDARSLADAWIVHGDFLLQDLPFSFTHAVGNPPYVRQERIPEPFMGWLMLIEDRDKSRGPVSDRSPHFDPFPEFVGASYADRYDILCRKLVQEQLYASATVLLSPKEVVDTGDYSELSETTGLRAFVTTLAGRIAAEAARTASRQTGCFEGTCRMVVSRNLYVKSDLVPRRGVIVERPG